MWKSPQLPALFECSESLRRYDLTSGYKWPRKWPLKVIPAPGYGHSASVLSLLFRGLFTTTSHHSSLMAPLAKQTESTPRLLEICWLSLYLFILRNHVVIFHCQHLAKTTFKFIHDLISSIFNWFTVYYFFTGSIWFYWLHPHPRCTLTLFPPKKCSIASYTWFETVINQSHHT